MAHDMTLFEFEVLVKAEIRYDELRQQVVSKRAKMVGKLQELGYGPDHLCLEDPKIPIDVREWLKKYQYHLRVRERIEEMREQVTGQKDWNILEGKASTHDAGPIGPRPDRIRNFGKVSDEMAFKTTVMDFLVYIECEKHYLELRKEIVSQREEMFGKLRRMGYDMDSLYMDDPNIPSDVHEWLEKYERHNLWRANCERLNAQIYGRPVQRWLKDYKQHLELKEHITRLRADITEEPWAEGPFLEKLLQDLPHAASRQMILQS